MGWNFKLNSRWIWDCCLKFRKRGNLEDEHINTKKLFFFVSGEETLTPREIWHLRRCDECLELQMVFRRLSTLSEDKPQRPSIKKTVNW